MTDGGKTADQSCELNVHCQSSLSANLFPLNIKRIDSHLQRTKNHLKRAYKLFYDLEEVVFLEHEFSNVIFLIMSIKMLYGNTAFAFELFHCNANLWHTVSLKSNTHFFNMLEFPKVILY